MTAVKVRLRVSAELGKQIEQALAPVAHEGHQMIDARRLHEWLGHKRMFAHWIKDRIEDYGFQEGSDFLPIVAKTKGRPRTDYYLTVNMAKELAMVERSQIGQLTRRYFIQMEQAATPSETLGFLRVSEKGAICAHPRRKNPRRLDGMYHFR